MDFKKATELFADKDFDGEPVMIYVPEDAESPVPPDNEPEETIHGEQLPPFEKGGIEGGFSKRMKYILGEVTVYVVSERVQYYGPEGKLITESLKDYTRSAVREDYSSLDDFLRIVNE